MGELSPSPSPSGSALSWESVTLSPLEILSLQYEYELQQLQDAHVEAKQNKNGVDLHAKTGKATGRLSIDVRDVQGVGAAIAEHPLLASASEPTLYVSAVLAPSSACEKSTKKHVRTTAVTIKSGNAKINEHLVYDGIKATTFTVKLTVNSSAGIVADIALGEVEVNASDFLDQSKHSYWYDLLVPASSPTSAGEKRGKIKLAITFEYSAKARHERAVSALLLKKKENDELIEAFRKNAGLIKSPVQHPAAFGAATARAELYIPGNRFRSDVHHPAAVSRAPLPDKSRVVTPFGRGVVVSFRLETRLYVVQLNKDPSAKRATIAYLRQSDVTEEPDVPHLKMYMKVATPYGNGEIAEIRPHDDVIVVQTSYAKMYMHRKDVKLPEKSVEDMKNKDLIEEAVKLTEQGNVEFRDGKFDEAVYSYLRSLGFLQRVNQDSATHKEKAEILQTMIRCHLNIGTCKLKTDCYVDAEIACTNALSILTVLAENKHGNVVTWMGRLGLSEQVMFEDWPSKARFRRAKALVKQGKLHDARSDLLMALRLSPKDKSIRVLLEQVSQLIVKAKSEEKKAWGGIFENTPAPSGDASDATPALVAPTKPKADPESSIFTRKSKSQREREGKQQAAAEASWLPSTKALAAASLVTAGVAAIAVLAMKQNK